MTSDQKLLQAFVRGSHPAFRELVERHSAMVYSLAWRATEDRAMAEEVAQEVFCLLARKSRALLAHPSLVGWLHRTTLNVARNHRRASRIHGQKLARFAAESSSPKVDATESADYAELDAAIDRLPEEVRAPIVLRFYQEQDYSQISSELGISEPTARKRVSRGLQRLHTLLRDPTLAAAAPGCLLFHVPSSLMETFSAVSSHVSQGSSFIYTLTAMNTKQTIALVASLALTGGLGWFCVRQNSENKRLKQEIASLHSQMEASIPFQMQGHNSSKSETDSAAKSPISDQLADLQTALASERDKRQLAESATDELRKQLEPLKDEVVVSFGKVSQIGSTFGSLFTEAVALVELEKKGELGTPENKERFANFLKNATSISGLGQEIIAFEDKPEEGSKFVASSFRGAFELSEAEEAKVAQFFATQLKSAGEKKLTLSHLPKQGSPEFQPWMEQRWAFFNGIREEMRNLLPPAKQATFDQTVEKGGYGFQNLKLNGFPLGFSLGGQPP